MARHHMTAAGPVPFTAQEEIDRDAEEAAAALPQIPQSVEKRKLMKALILANRDDDVTAALAGGGQQGKLDRADWAELVYVRRDSAIVAKIAVALNLSGAAVDALFTTAAALNGG